MSRVVDEHKRTVPREGMVTEGGVDSATGSATGALAGAIVGAAGGPLGMVAGAVIGGAMGSIAATGKERPESPDGWYTEQARGYGDDNPLTDFDHDKRPRHPKG
ncbi:MAG: hypothetical protein ACOY94_08515 [Bacillota bacterium]